METSVVNALITAGLYKPAGKIEEQTLKTIAPDGSTASHIMAEIDYNDLKIFADELDIALTLQNQRVQSLFAKNAVLLAQTIRVVQYNTRSGFKGSKASGNALDFLLFRAEQFQNPDAAGVAARGSFNRAIAVAASLQFITAPDALGANTHAALTMAANEAFALLGFANTSPSPCTSAVQLTYLGQVYNLQNLGFEMFNPFIGDPIVELKQPLVIFPGENGLVDVRYFQNGADELRPIGIWFKIATNLRALATS